MVELPKFLYVITWIDCSGQTNNWMDKNKIMEHKPLTVFSCGFLLKETDDFITIAGTEVSNDDVSGTFCIPKHNIVKKKKIKI